MDLSDIIMERWAEAFFLVLIIAGAAVSISIKSALVSYIVIFFAGILAGRAITKMKGKKIVFPYILIIIGFLVGYLLGSIAIDINRFLIIIIFLIGSYLSYFVHKKGYLK